MEVYEFEKQMKNVLKKAGKASGMTLDWQVVSGDPDCISDFGSDYEGNLSICGHSFPLKIKDMTGIRYRWNNPECNDYSDCFYRFDFGEEIYLDCCFDDCGTGCMYHIKYYDTYKHCLDQANAIALLKQFVG